MTEEQKTAWHCLTLALYRKGWGHSDIRDAISKSLGIDVSYEAVRSYIRYCRKKDPNLKPDAEDDVIKVAAPVVEKKPALQNQEPKVHKSKWDGTKIIKFAIIGDTQIGSKYTQLTYLHEFYELCRKEGITDVYHTGDITDGLKMRIGHEYEL